MTIRHEDAPTHRQLWAPPNRPRKFARLFRAAGISPRMRFVSTESGTVHYEETGDPAHAPVLFIHGSPGGWHHFVDYLADAALLKVACLRAADRPGYGRSQPGLPEPRLSVQAQTMAACIDDAPAVVVGHSYGGPVAIRLAATHPEKVAGLILISPVLDPGLEPGPWYDHVAGHPAVNRLLPRGWRSSVAEVRRLREELEELQPLIQNVNCPVVLIHGERDRLVPYSTHIAFAHEHLEDIPVRTHHLIHADHYLPWTHFERVHAVLLRMLERTTVAVARPEG
ncbi:MAG: pimeloyl-ACP methyl ester carboxylesterase [Kiritimatiellia bacterium]|jgi:pimeloyl-ACP methyl ester carboxylesterase